MSAAILLKQRDSACILTDAAGYYGNGIVAQFADKCQSLPELHCAFTTFGPLMWQKIIATGIRESGFVSFDAMKAGMASLMREPKPNARSACSPMCSFTCTYSDTIVAFQAPPAAVTKPVTR